jgi:hypothetical protein
MLRVERALGKWRGKRGEGEVRANAARTAAAAG